MVLCATLVALPASAHPPRTTAVLLALAPRTVEMELQIPLDQLAMALEQSIAPSPEAWVSARRASLIAYLTEHVALVAPDGRPFEASFNAASLSVNTVDESPTLLARASFVPPAGAAADVFTLRDTAVLHRVVSHKSWVSVRQDFANGVFADAPEVLGVIRYQRESLLVDRSHGSVWRGLSATFLLGAHHLREGSDHLLFLLLLLVAAPLGFHRHTRRWQEANSARATLRRVVMLVSAFTLGHSLTLALAAFGVARLPSRPVEIAIAASILVSAVHAARPVFPRHEAWVAAAFGLVHGLGFASAMAALGFQGSHLALSLLGFNLGLEAMQLVVVAAALPSLWLLAQHRPDGYRVVRLGGAAFGGMAAAGWLIERMSGQAVASTKWVEAVFARGPWVLAALGAVAIVATIAGRTRRAPRGEVGAHS